LQPYQGSFCGTAILKSINDDAKWRRIYRMDFVPERTRNDGPAVDVATRLDECVNAGADVKAVHGFISAVGQAPTKRP
jgi:hypothetical protein